ncbi:putative reverse transcriptase domain-containing protein [Tanacetum coccineum]
MRQRRWIELLSDYECEIKYHPGKTKILEAQGKASKGFLSPTGMAKRLERHFEQRAGLRKFDFFNHGEVSKDLYNEIVAETKEALGTRLDMSTAYHPQTDGQSERIYSDNCRICFSLSHVIWLKLKKVSLWTEIYARRVKRCSKLRKDRRRLRVAQKSDKRCKPLEFQVGDRVLLKVSPWKGVVRFGKKGKLAPRYVGPFEIVECVGPVAYRLKLPQELSCVHDTFHVSNLKKCLAEPDVQVPLDEIEIDENLRFVEEPIEIVERDVKKLKQRRIPLVKVRWNSRQGAEYTWEHEDQFRMKYPHLFSEPVPSSNVAT